jgi:hypothetical protein
MTSILCCTRRTSPSCWASLSTLVGHGDAPVLSEVANSSSSRQDAPFRYRVAVPVARSALPRERFSPLPSRPGEFHPEPLTDPHVPYKSLVELRAAYMPESGRCLIPRWRLPSWECNAGTTCSSCATSSTDTNSRTSSVTYRTRRYCSCAKTTCRSGSSDRAVLWFEVAAQAGRQRSQVPRLHRGRHRCSGAFNRLALGSQYSLDSAWLS